MPNMLRKQQSRRSDDRLVKSEIIQQYSPSELRAILGIEEPTAENMEQEHVPALEQPQAANRSNGPDISSYAMHLQQQQLHSLVQTQERLVQTQEETVRALSDLNEAIQKLQSALEKNTIQSTMPQNQFRQHLRRGLSSRRPTDTGTAVNQPHLRRAFSSRRPTDDGTGGNPYHVSTPFLSQPQRRLSVGEISDLDTSVASLEETVGDELDFDRKQVRLDGLEVYAVVSALTAGTMVDVFDLYNPGDIVDLYVQGRFLEVFLSAFFAMTGTIGIVCGLHCIFVFSLITMYGRTALGMQRDDALEIFFGTTGLQRIHGFRTFVGSLYALMIQLVIVITSKISNNPWVLLAVLGGTVCLMYYVHTDTQIIMEKAKVIFASPAPLITQQKEEDASDSTSAISQEDTGENDTLPGSREKSLRDIKIELCKGKSCMNMPATSLMSDDNDGSISELKDKTSSNHRSSSVGSASTMKSASNKKTSVRQSAMVMSATACDGLKEDPFNRWSKAIKFSLDHGEGSQNDIQAASTSAKQSIVSRALNKARPALKKTASGKKTSLAYIAENEVTENRNRRGKLRTRSSLSQPAAMQMIGSMDDSD